MRASVIFQGQAAIERNEGKASGDPGKGTNTKQGEGRGEGGKKRLSVSHNVGEKRLWDEPKERL